MRKTSFFLLLFIVVSFGCNKSSTPNPDTYLFDFNFELSNSFLIESSEEFVTTNNGYLMDEFIYDNVGSAASNLFLSNGVFPDTLTTVCGIYNYIENPSAEVRIWFPFTTLQDGLYTYSKDSSTNDFTISIFSNMLFDSVDNSSLLVSRDLIASSSGAGLNPYNVDLAQIKIENSSANSAELRFVVLNNSGELIRGSYVGNLDAFKLKSSSADCD